MPFLRNLLPRHADGEGWLSPKSPRSPRSPKSPKSPKPLTYTAKNTEELDQCLGCNNVEYLIAENAAGGKKDEGRVSSVLLHNSFDELERCASKCQICRVYRQSLLLNEVTFEGVRELRKTNGQVNVHWQEKTAQDGHHRAFLSVEVKDRPGHAGVVNCNSRNEIEHLALRPYSHDPTVIDQAKQWLHTCLEAHVGQCDNLKFSSENPELLIEIQSPDYIRLRDSLPIGTPYVALSYCWGNPKIMSADENAEVERGKTFTTNVGPRHKSFAIRDLPTTVRDALQIVYSMGLRYAWIDTLCVLQDAPTGVATMHKVYANALFTLCSCATTRATQKLLDRRYAWSEGTEPCCLGGQWLTTSDMSLNELRLTSPLAYRAWTLQEERLSPRMLYVTSSRMYWSCAACDEMELKPIYGQKMKKLQRPVYASSDRNLEMPMAQEFLMACRAGGGNLHPFWADTVKSYASRDMTNLSDRLQALSGLAAKYLSADRTDEYLAGIWANNLAEGLLWKVTGAVYPKTEKEDIATAKWPSWSWATLPVQTVIDANVNSAPAASFQRIPDDTNRSAGGATSVEEAIEQGQEVKQICVYGRVRNLWKPDSRRIDWGSVSKFVNEEEKFTFAALPEQDAHAIQQNSGRILVYEDRKKEVISQLDFGRDISRVQSNEVDLLALEVGETAMVLVEQCGQGIYRRVGAAWDVRKDFFTGADGAVLYLR